VCVGIDEVQKLISSRSDPATGKDGAAAAISGVLKPLVIGGHAGAVVCAAVAGLAVQAERYLLYGLIERAEYIWLPSHMYASASAALLDGYAQMLATGLRF
jgi:hypothetical protein